MHTDKVSQEGEQLVDEGSLMNPQTDAIMKEFMEHLVTTVDKSLAFASTAVGPAILDGEEGGGSMSTSMETGGAYETRDASVDDTKTQDDAPVGGEATSGVDERMDTGSEPMDTSTQSGEISEKPTEPAQIEATTVKGGETTSDSIREASPTRPNPVASAETMATIHAMLSEFAIIRTDMRLLAADHEKAQEHITKSDARIVSMQEELDKCNATVKEKEEEHDEAQTVLANLTNSHRKLAGESVSKDEKIVELENEIIKFKELENEIIKLKERLVAKDKELDEVSADRDRIETDRREEGLRDRVSTDLDFYTNDTYNPFKELVMAVQGFLGIHQDFDMRCFEDMYSLLRSEQDSDTSRQRSIDEATNVKVFVRDAVAKLNGLNLGKGRAASATVAPGRADAVSRDQCYATAELFRKYVTLVNTSNVDKDEHVTKMSVQLSAALEVYNGHVAGEKVDPSVIHHMSDIMECIDKLTPTDAAKEELNTAYEAVVQALGCICTPLENDSDSDRAVTKATRKRVSKRIAVESGSDDESVDESSPKKRKTAANTGATQKVMNEDGTFRVEYRGWTYFELGGKMPNDCGIVFKQNDKEFKLTYEQYKDVVNSAKARVDGYHTVRAHMKTHGVHDGRRDSGAPRLTFVRFMTDKDEFDTVKKPRGGNMRGKRREDASGNEREMDDEYATEDGEDAEDEDNAEDEENAEDAAPKANAAPAKAAKAALNKKKANAAAAKANAVDTTKKGAPNKKKANTGVKKRK